MACSKVVATIRSMAGNEVATVATDLQERCREFALKVAAATGHDHFKLVADSEVLPLTGPCTIKEFLNEKVRELLVADGDGTDVVAITFDIIVQDVGVLRVWGIPEGTVFGGHLQAPSCEGSLEELNGDWTPLPLIGVNGFPVFHKATNLRNQSEYEDDGVRYLIHMEGTILDIAWLPRGVPATEENLLARQQLVRHGFIASPAERLFPDVLQDGFTDARVYLALTKCDAFPDVGHCPGWGENTPAGWAALVR